MKPATPHILMTVAAVPLIALSCATIVPPWSMPTLIAVVAATEYSPVLAIADLLWLGGYLYLSRGGRAATWLRGVALFVLLGVPLALRPLVQFRATSARVASQLGDDGEPLRFSPTAMFRQLAAPGVRERTLSYTAADGSPLTMRLYDGASRSPRPIVVVVYGGAWRSGTASQGANVSRALAARGFMVAAIDYRHAPAHRFPAQLDDVRRSLDVLFDSAAAWNVDSTRVALLGRSAGGHLAELTAYTPRRHMVRAVIALYAPFDLTEGYANPPNPDPIDTRAVLRDFIGATPAEQPAQFRAASPSSVVRAGAPPVLLIYGGRDHVVKPAFNRQAAQALRAVHVPVVQLEIPWAEHGFDMAPGGLGAQLAFDSLLRFLDRWVSADTAARHARDIDAGRGIR